MLGYDRILQTFGNVTLSPVIHRCLDRVTVSVLTLKKIDQGRGIQGET
jgi:hypothetical protein